MHRTFLVTLLTACSLIAGCAARHTWVLTPGQHPQSFERRVTVETHGRFLLYLPAGFDPSGRTRYPLLIFLHGSGESGEDLEKVKVHGPPKLFAAIAPVCGGDARLTVYLYTGHDSWNQAYADPELYQWLLQQRRRAVRKP